MISRRIFAAVAMLCALMAPAHAQKTKAQLATEIGTTYPDNTVGAITPAGVRAYETDVINSIMPTAPVVSGNLACFNGTTGLLLDCGWPASLTAHGVLLGEGGSTFGVVAGSGGNSSLPLISQGASLDPIYAPIGFSAIAGFGTGVATALGVNTGTAGAFVVNGGALGSPSSVGTFPAFGSGAHIITSAGGSALAVGPSGTTNSAFNVDASTGSMAAGLNVAGAVTGGTVAIRLTDPGANTSVSFSAKGNGNIAIGTATTGSITLGAAATPITHQGQIISTFGTPTIASGACGTGTNGSISGTNQSGIITIGAVATTTCTVSFSATITAPGACVVFPGNATAAATGTTVARVGTPSTTAWVLTGSALASTVYSYICI